MSFGASAGDIIIVVTFCRALYRKCRSAGGECVEISREVRGLHTVLKHLKHEAEAPESLLSHDQSIWGRQLAPIIGDCNLTLQQLDELLQKYGRLGGGSSPSSPSSARALWDRIKFGSNELDTLGSIRMKLLSHKTTLTLFLDTIQLHQSGKVSQKLDSHGGQLDSILDKVDNIAARMGQREGSIMTSYDDDDKEVWKQFRRELVAEGFSSDVLQQHKDVLRAYIRQIEQNGLLDEPRTPPPSMLSPKQWVESIQSEDSTVSRSMSARTDSGTKEMVVREDNMKFPQSMKQELRRPEARRSGLELSQPNPSEYMAEENNPVNSRTLPISIIVPSQAITSDEKEVMYQNTDVSSSNDEFNRESGAIIRTSDLLALTRALQLHVSGSSPATSFRSSLGSIADDEALRSMAYRPKRQVDPRNSLSQLDGTPASNSLGANPHPSSVHKLAPDQSGREIPPDAKWTKIKRSLVSPEVLQQDGRRYEARPDFVAVLGILRRPEIEALAIRSQDLRASRQRRNMPAQSKREVPPPRPQRPTAAQHQQSSFSFDSASQAYDGREPSLSSSRSSADSDSDSNYEHRRRRRQLNINNEDHRRSSGSLAIPIRRYPNPYGVPPPPLNPKSANSTAQQAMYMSGALSFGDRGSAEQSQSWNNNYSPHPEKAPHNNSFQNTTPRAENWAPQLPSNPRSNQQYPVRNERENERGDRNRSRDKERDYRRRHSSNQDRHREHRDHSRHSNHSNSPIPKQAKHSRWKENLASAGIGGAAATLLNVLTEAAEAL